MKFFKKKIKYPYTLCFLLTSYTIYIIFFAIYFDDYYTDILDGILIVLASVFGSIVFLLTKYIKESTIDMDIYEILSKILIAAIVSTIVVSIAVIPVAPSENVTTQDNKNLYQTLILVSFSLGYSNSFLLLFLNKIVNLSKGLVNNFFPQIESDNADFQIDDISNLSLIGDEYKEMLNCKEMTINHFRKFEQENTILESSFEDILEKYRICRGIFDLDTYYFVPIQNEIPKISSLTEEEVRDLLKVGYLIKNNNFKTYIYSYFETSIAEENIIVEINGVNLLHHEQLTLRNLLEYFEYLLLITNFKTQ